MTALTRLRILGVNLYALIKRAFDENNSWYEGQLNSLPEKPRALPRLVDILLSCIQTARIFENFVVDEAFEPFSAITDYF